MCDFTDFVTFSNAQNDTCFVKQTFWGGAFIIFIKEVFLSRLFGGSIHYFSGKSLVKQKKSI